MKRPALGMKVDNKNSTGADGVPRSQFCTCATLRSAPHQHQWKFFRCIRLLGGGMPVNIFINSAATVAPVCVCGCPSEKSIGPDVLSPMSG